LPHHTIVPLSSDTFPNLLLAPLLFRGAHVARICQSVVNYNRARALIIGEYLAIEIMTIRNTTDVAFCLVLPKLITRDACCTLRYIATSRNRWFSNRRWF